MTTAPCVCPSLTESPTLYVSVVAGVLLILSEVLGYYNKRHPSNPTSITEVAERVVRAGIKAVTPPSSPPTSVHEGTPIAP